MQPVQWWVLALNEGVLVWARLRELDGGQAEVLDSTGLTLRFDDWDSARHSLLELGYRAFDGLDQADAHAMGFDLDEICVPEAADEYALVQHMTQPLAHMGRH